jgi:mono/diheme cytochrome c family protein
VVLVGIVLAASNALGLESSPEAIEAGKQVYQRRCVFCHGDEGAGDGPVADYLDPRPRDFTLGIFKFRSTKTGGLPTDEDLFRTITEGVLGTAMPKWGVGDGILSEEERWQVLHYIKSFSMGIFDDPEFDPESSEWKVSVGDEPPATAESIAAGDEIFHDIGRGACVKCHGVEGRGDGADSEKGLVDDWGFGIVPRNLTEGWRFKRGTAARDIYLTLRGGLMGTPMPSVADTISEEETWQLAHYVTSLVEEDDTSGKVILQATFAADGIPEDPDDERWSLAPALDIPMVGQVLVAPRWQNPSVQRVRLRAKFDDEKLAIHATWDDRTEDRGGDVPDDLGLRNPDAKPGEVETYFSVERARARGQEDISDALLLQFPIRIPDSPVKPHFYQGSSREKANQWFWSAHRQNDEGAGVVEQVARGIDKPEESQAEDNQQVTSRAIWRNGQWQAVFVRPLRTEDAKSDIQFEAGQLIPLAANAWDASSGEWGLQRSVSSWYYLELEQSVAGRVYVASAAVALLVAGLQILLIRRTAAAEADGVGDRG